MFHCAGTTGLNGWDFWWILAKSPLGCRPSIVGEIMLNCCFTLCIRWFSASYKLWVIDLVCSNSYNMYLGMELVIKVYCNMYLSSLEDTEHKKVYSIKISFVVLLQLIMCCKKFGQGSSSHDTQLVNCLILQPHILDSFMVSMVSYTFSDNLCLSSFLLFMSEHLLFLFLTSWSLMQ